MVGFLFHFTDERSSKGVIGRFPVSSSMSTGGGGTRRLYSYVSGSDDEVEVINDHSKQGRRRPGQGPTTITSGGIYADRRAVPADAMDPLRRRRRDPATDLHWSLPDGQCEKLVLPLPTENATCWWCDVVFAARQCDGFQNGTEVVCVSGRI